MKTKVDEIDIVLEKKDHEIAQANSAVLDIEFELGSLREEIEELNTNNEILQRKRINGIKELDKLKMKIEDLKITHNLNISMNTSFSMEALDTKEYNIRGTAQEFGELLNM